MIKFNTQSGQNKRKIILKNKLEKIFFTCYLLALMFAGVFVMSITPPWEGFDETAHYSSVRYIWDLKKIPLYGSANLDAAVEAYRGPKPYGTLNPPFDSEMTYEKFFRDKGNFQEYIELYNANKPMPAFVNGNSINWQTQHPPLYYIMLAPVLGVTSNMALVDQIFVLRFCSLLMAIVGVAFGYQAFRNKKLPLRKDPVVLGFLLYPLVLPMVFFEFARMGNDALCLLFTGLLAYVLRRAWGRNKNYKYALVCGLIIGLGLLTKAFFIPIAVAVVCWMLVEVLYRWRLNGVLDFRSVRVMLTIFGVATLVGGWWYLYKIVAVGSLSGSFDGIVLASQGGFWAGFVKNASIFAILRGGVATVVTYIWAGSWSLVRLPVFIYLPQVLLVFFIFLGYFAYLKKNKKEIFTQISLPLWFFAFFGMGMLHHIFISVAINGNGNTPGWYLHILLPWVAPAIGVGAVAFRSFKWAFWGLFSYAIIFALVAMWSQYALFMGCATKSLEKLYEFNHPLFCVPDFMAMSRNLEIIGMPEMTVVGMAGFLVSFAIICKIWIGNSGNFDIDASKSMSNS